MNHLQPEKLPLETPNPVLARLEVLREHLPEIFSDGKIDLERLKTLLGDELEGNRERFGLSWAGKAEAVRAVQISSTGALRPKRDQSVNFDSTSNAIIEGDNLEVLKLLQRSYHNKIKMIYIDPPYNTGNDFVYPDNFRDGLRQYQLFSGQISDDGSKLTTSGDHAGRIHSRWLSMMYPRLQLAKSLLKDDGVIFISIDDHELSSLRMVMDEIFGEENFISQIIINANKRGQTYKEIAKQHEYLLLYAKSDSYLLSEIEKGANDLPFQDSIGNFDLWELRNRNPKFNRQNRPNLYFSVFVSENLIDENGYSKVSLQQTKEFNIEVYPRNSEGTDGCWRWSKAKILTVDLIGNSPDLIAKKRRDGEWNIYEKSRKSTTKAKSIWDESQVISEQGTVELKSLELADYFDFPKPMGLLQKIINISTAPESDDLVLDFFAGSGTLGQAVLEQNMLDGGNRKFILVQLPETTPNASFPTISSVTRERVKRAAAKIRESMNGSLNLESPPDLGFRAFTLEGSNFKIWDNENPDLEGQLLALVQNVVDGRSEEDILFELLLKSGLPLSSGITTVIVAEKRVYSVSQGTLLICLERPITSETLRGMMALKPAQVLCLDVAFEGDDALKTNMVLEMRDHEILFRTV